MTPEPPSGDSPHGIHVLTRSTTHDLNNFMFAIMSFAELVLDHMGEAHPLRDEIQGILEVGERVVAKTRELDQLACKLAQVGES